MAVQEYDGLTVRGTWIDPSTMPSPGSSSWRTRVSGGPVRRMPMQSESAETAYGGHQRALPASARVVNNRIADDAEQAAAVLEASGELPVLGLPGSVVLSLADEAGRAVHTGAFPDRAYDPDGL